MSLQHIRLKLFILAALLASFTPLAGLAAIWDGTSVASSLRGSGTDADPYLIGTPEEFIYIIKHKDVWNKVFVQETDIDFGGHALPGIIGYGRKNVIFTTETSTINDIYPFSGKYNGHGYKLANWRLCWDSQAMYDSTDFGLFGFCTGQLRNIHIDNATMFRTSTATDLYFDGIHVGLLVGELSPRYKTDNKDFEVCVENIIITNSRIEEGPHPLRAQAMFIGGVIGDISSGHGHYNTITNNDYGKLTIRNIYADVDIHLPEAINASSGKLQLNVGGILGRIRRGRYPDLPDNTYYTGTITCPQAMIAPTWASARHEASNNASGLTSMLVGEVIAEAHEDEVSANANLSAGMRLGESSTITYKGETFDPATTRFFGNFHIGTEEITDTYPTVNPSRQFGSRLRALSPTASTSNMESYQGVALATYVDDVEDVLTNFFNPYANVNNLNPWIKDEDGVRFTGSASLAIEQEGYNQIRLVLGHANNHAENTFEWKGVLLRDGSTVDIPASAVSGPDDKGRYTIDRLLSYSSVTAYHCENGVHTGVTGTAPITLPTEFTLERDGIDGFVAGIKGYDDNVFETGDFHIEWVGEALDADNNRVEETTAETDTNIVTLANAGALSYVTAKIYVRNDIDDLYYLGSVEYIADKDLLLEIKRETDPVSGKEYYVASVYNGNQPDSDHIMLGGDRINPLQDPNFGYIWEVSSDPSTRRSWESTDVNNYSQNWILPASSERYYRASLVRLTRNAANEVIGYKVITERIIGPVNIVFVYNKAQTTTGRNAHITTFDGKDRWIDSEGVSHVADFPDGDDANTGYDPYHAVRTMQRAYELLDADAGVDGNKIVVMGFYFDRNFLLYRSETEGMFAKPTEITGRMGAVIYDGAINMSILNHSDAYVQQLQAATRFTDITWDGHKKSEVNGGIVVNTLLSSQCLLYCAMNDLTIGDNVKIRGYELINTDPTNGTLTYGLLDYTKAPHITIVGGVDNFDGDEVPQPLYNVDNRYATININSGCYGRIIAGARNNDSSMMRRVYGSPDKPHRVRINISITHSTPEGNEFHPGADYDYDIGLVTGGQTDGSCFSEALIFMNSGSIGRYIAGTISYGRQLKTVVGSDGTSFIIPTDSYFGSTTLNLQGGTIYELFGGSLGRLKPIGDAITLPCEAYFYGRSILNIDGGTVGNIKTFDINDPSTYGNIYGAGSGGVAGLGDDTYHTLDKHIPYMPFENSTEVYYGSYKDIQKRFPGENQVAEHLPVMDLIFETDPAKARLALADTYSEVHLASGVVYGSVFGGGFGFTTLVPPRCAMTQAGNFFGNALVEVSSNHAESITVMGSIYGAGSGSDGYYNALGEGQRDNYKALGQLYGNSTVYVSNGTIEGNVYGGARGVAGFDDMGDIFGNVSLTVEGDALIKGNIFGGSAFGSINYDSDGNRGDISVRVSGNPTVGNNIFGACEGEAPVTDDEGNVIYDGTDTEVAGSVSMLIDGGNFYPDPYIHSFVEDPLGGEPQEILTPRTFNIYGGGYLNCQVAKDVTLTINRSLLTNMASVMPAEDNPNHPISYVSNFDAAFQDITFRRFCVYGGGFGEHATVLGSTNVTIDIPTNTSGYKLPVAMNREDFAAGQMFFDVAGGGYSGSLGRWTASPDGTDAYYEYVGGDANVTIKGYPFIRKVIGGGFYGDCRSTNTTMISGKVGSIYGGALLGYVHNNARLRCGSRTSDFEDASQAAFYNSHLYVTEDVYGGNDVKGIVGTERWVGYLGETGVDVSDGGPLFYADVSDEDDKGVNLDLFGGTFQGNVYGGGNGHYRGYYVPEWTRYNDGNPRQYRSVRSSVDPSGRGRVYRSRPMVGSVKVNIAGNSTTDRVHIQGNFFGGGRSCTIGQWNTALPFEDPRRLVAGGFLHVNFGGHTTIDGNAYMGSQGEYYAEQSTVPADVDVSTFDGSAYADLQRMGDAAYDHWYWDIDAGRYLPGYPDKGKVDGNYFMTGEHLFRGYMKNIEMNGDVEVTFYKDLYDEDGNRRRWLPIEMAVNDYDAEDVRMNSFFLGGQVGSMTNNISMQYVYHDEGGDEPQQYGSIYRFTIPRGVTILEKVVGGSENAFSRYYDYAPGFHSLLKEDNAGNDLDVYKFEGGVVTQSIFSYDLIVWNDRHYNDPGKEGVIDRFGDPEDRQIDYKLYPSDPAYYSYTLQNFDAGTTIYRFQAPKDNPAYHEANFIDDIYALAVIAKNDHPSMGADGCISIADIDRGYVGPRDGRKHVTAVKCHVAATFEPQPDTEAGIPEGEYNLFGGLIYGGCYNSGVTIGDVIVLTSANMLGNAQPADVSDDYRSIATLRYNIGRVFGGGFGEDTRIEGNTCVNLINRFQGMNVFGGGMRGSVTGKSTINYVGSETESYIYGAIYGGGLMGPVGTYDNIEAGTELNLVSGNVSHVYGGSCMGDIYGPTQVNLFDEVTTDLPYFDYRRLVQYAEDVSDWSGSRLIAGNVFGGNDVAGNIVVADETIFNTTVNIYEVQNPQAVSEPEEGVGPGKTSPGSDNGYNGFPLVGSLFGGSNGDYGVHTNTNLYTAGNIDVANGRGAAYYSVNLAHSNITGLPYEVPHIERSQINLRGGTIINAYGGGDMSTINERDVINVEYPQGNMRARAGFSSQEELDRLWRVCRISHAQQIDEVTETNDEGTVFKYQIFNLFGGNDHADMDIQPEWNLVRAHVGSLYSGANFGRMTFYSEFDRIEEDGEEVLIPSHRGLTLTVNSKDMYIHRLFGGGRIGDIHPSVPMLANETSGLTPSEIDQPWMEDFYGATLNIYDGVIDEVYGGNDVAGEVYYGTNVNIYGAISGDVYCSGNGDYYYQYDPTVPHTESIVETYDERYGRYFILPQRRGYGGESPINAQRLLAINAWRPNVGKSKLTIEGADADHLAYVTGRVFCGGNSATVYAGEEDLSEGSIKLEIGSNVILNGVFFGSNGEKLTVGRTMYITEVLNGFDLTEGNGMTATEVAMLDQDPTKLALHDADAIDKDLYSSLLDVYMRAVEVYAKPRDFKFPEDMHNSYIGNFYVGGNCGSMMTRETIHLNFPESLVVYGRICGGSRLANVTYKGMPHVGGLRAPLHRPDLNPNKVELVVKSRFEPWELHLEENAAGRFISATLVPNILTYDDGKPHYPFGKCEVIGGCYSSGTTVGGIKIDLLSDMLADFPADSPLSQAILAAGASEHREVIMNGVNTHRDRSFTLLGGGYGDQTAVYGDINVRMLPGKASPTYVAGVSPEHPTVCSIFGGSQDGLVVGNTTVEVRDGSTLANIYGGSEAARLYGSTQVLVGWPEYYVCNTAGSATLNRTDNISRAAIDPTFHNADGTSAIRRHVTHRVGDIISRNVYEIMPEADKARFTYTALAPSDYEVVDTNGVVTKPLTWDDIRIEIGDQRSRADLSMPYYGNGNIYGGGYVSSAATTSLAGKNTVCRFDAEHNLGDGGYNPAATETTPSAGGNSTILIWDNSDNANTALAVGEAQATDGSYIRDHITIGTGTYVKQTMTVGQDIMGYYVKETDPSSPNYGRFIHQSPHVLGRDANGNNVGNADPLLSREYYKIESDGGVYGGGRKVYVEGFRDCDIAYYGYAESSPQFPKLINTAQRLDLLTITDCCLQFQGANDFANNSLDASLYSMTRIGELQLRSSLVDVEDLYPGERESSGLYNILHPRARTRNYVSFFHNVRYLSAITSNQDFNSPYRGANGQRGAIGDFMVNGSLQRPEEMTVPAGCTYVDLDPADDFSYRGYKMNRIDNYYNNRNLPSTQADPQGLTPVEEFRVKTSLEFDQRNVGTAANMIGINNGYVLRVQGAVVDNADNDVIYYGPITGIVEVKLMTLARDEGGGYIFALNKHEHAEAEEQTFLETTGNFIFPGAAYRVSDSDVEKYNYIYDDCFPMGLGYDYYIEKGEVDDYLNGEGQEIHYWYVNGNQFFYNVTLTGYTYPDSRDFHLDTNDNLIYLYGVIPGNTKFEIDEIAWEPMEGYDHDIPCADSTDGAYDRDYRLFLSVDRNTESVHNLEPDNPYIAHSYVSAIPRADYDSTNGSQDAVVGNPNDSAVNNYSDYDTGNNMPLLGITLLDNVDNSGKTHYEEHLKEDTKVRLVIKAHQVDEHGNPGTDFTYTVNLTIKYLLGPTITGLPVIENGALPGEYIYANAFDINVELDDDNMAVTDRNWYIVAPEIALSDNHSIQQVINWVKAPTAGETYAAECINDQMFDNDRQVHIPAYLYRNGWHLVYEIVANNTPFYLHPDSKNSGSTIVDKPYTDHLVVHNYHRMRPYDGTSILLDAAGQPLLDANNNTQPRLEDLRHTAGITVYTTDQDGNQTEYMRTEGARIYIEDDNDMAYFYTWLKNCQTAPTRQTPRGYDIDPQYGEGLHIYLMKDVKMPELTAADGIDISSLVFKGTFHGNGHSIQMGKNQLFLGENGGAIYNTGFISELKPSQGTPIVVGRNRSAGENNGVAGRIESCFFYNPVNNDNGSIVDDDRGAIVNCFQTSVAHTTANMDAVSDAVPGLRHATVADFNYGEVAYNLNRFYLKKRYNLATATPDGDLVEPINFKFRNGDYRFARYSNEGIATALRTADIPNYHDYMGIRINFTQESYGAVTGADASMHNPADLIDETRAVRDAGNNIILDRFNCATYVPNYPFDYLFFGQNLNTIAVEGTAVEGADYYHGVPTTVTEENRVFRASGFYGSNVDRGFHFNVDATALQPTLTAIDFSGYRDHYTGHDRYGLEYEQIYADQVCYYPPMIDLPEKMTSFSIDPAITHNLLLYNRPADTATADAIGDYSYGFNTDESDISAHLIDATNLGGAAYPAEVPRTELFHLVDLHDFDCPIAFDVTNTAWYQRRPGVFSNGGDAWEGLCIPFTATRVTATVESTSANPVRDHGELTHFYGTDACGVDEDGNGEADSHEYWLRKFTGVELDGENLRAYFTRPASNVDLEVANPVEEKVDEYDYCNDYFQRTYGQLGTWDDSHCRAAYTAGMGVKYRQYPLITNRFPYIISVPGTYFYEFDLSDKFYQQKFPGAVDSSQLLTYSNTGRTDADGVHTPVTIQVSTLNPPVAMSHGGYTYVGTYMRRQADAYTAVINPDDGYNNSYFQRPESAGTLVMPFRTYLQMPTSMPAPMRISSRTGDYMGQGIEEDPDEFLGDELNDIEIFVEGRDLVVLSPYSDLTLPLFDVNGRLMRHLRVAEGENRYHDLTSGYYLLIHTKFQIR